nr:6140_t:CDS:1 [Entrophospora candida]
MEEFEHLNINGDRNQYRNNNSVDIITILLFGNSGSGKSTLANVISNSKDYDASHSSISSTKYVHTRNYAIDGKVYKIIDTVGIRDTGMTLRDMMSKLVFAAETAKCGVNQVLFVTNGNFSNKEIETLELLQSIAFDKSIFKYTTIVRTNFHNFEDDVECEKNYQDMISEDDKISLFVKSCKNVIHIDNPPITHRTRQVAGEIREESRRKILSYLHTCTEIYMPKNLQEIIDAKIKNYMTEKEKLLKEISDLKRQMNEEKKSENGCIIL